MTARRRSSVFLALASLVLGCLVVCARPAWGQPQVQVTAVAYEGMAVPGFAPGTEFFSFGGQFDIRPPVINAQGHTAFLAKITRPGIGGAADGVWLADPNGNITNIALEGDQAVGAPEGVTYNGFSERLILDQSGNLAFGSVLSNNDDALFATDNNAVRLVVSESTELPNTNGNPVINNLVTNFGRAQQPDFVFNAGRLAVLINDVTHDDPDPNANPGDRERLNGIWSERPTSASRELQVVARDGIETIFTGLIGPPVINGLGQVSLRSDIQEAFDEPRRGSIWTEAGGTGTLTKVVESGGTDAEGDVEFSGFGNPVLNTNGQNAFEATLSDPPLDANSALFVQQPLQSGIVLNEGAGAPGVPGGGTFGDFSRTSGNLVVNQAGHLAFNTNARREDQPSVNGIWARRGAGIEAIGVTGMPAPGTDGFFFVTSDFLPVMNGNSDVAFFAQVLDEEGNGIGDGIWAEQDGVLHRVIGTGDTIQLPDGSEITLGIGDLDFIGGSGNQDGRPSGFSDNGEVVFRLFGSGGVLTATVPEPGSLALLGLGGLLIAGRRR